MDYFYVFQNWLYQTSLYQNILKEMPAPLNNIYFDSLLVICIIVYLLYRVIEAVRIAGYHKRIRKMREVERKTQSEREQEMSYWEQQVNEKEERIGRFLDYMEYLFTSRMRRPEDQEGYSSGKNSKRLVRRNFFLEKRDIPNRAQGEEVTPSSDYDVVMDAFAYDVKQEQEISKRQEVEKEQLNLKLSSLDDSLRVEETECRGKEDVSVVDVDLEKRRNRARREEEKERRRAERLLKKKQKGAYHGRLGK